MKSNMKSLTLAFPKISPIKAVTNGIQALIRNRNRIARTILYTLVGGIMALLGGRGFSALAAMGKIYAAADVPAREIAIIYGAEVFRDGTLSSMLYDRVKTGVALYEAGKVKILLMTADNGREDYNETEAMRDVAISLGVPASAIVLDYAGFRTFDSCYRARDVFKVKQAILVTQAFHLDRALLICNALGMTPLAWRRMQHGPLVTIGVTC